MQHCQRDSNLSLGILYLYLDIVIVICLSGSTLCLLRNTFGSLANLTRILRQIIALHIVAINLNPTSLAFMSVLVVRLVAVPNQHVLLDTLYSTTTNDLCKTYKTCVRVDDVVQSLQLALLARIGDGRDIVLEHVFCGKRYILPNTDAVDVEVCSVLSEYHTTIRHRACAELRRWGGIDKLSVYLTVDEDTNQRHRCMRQSFLFGCHKRIIVGVRINRVYDIDSDVCANVLLESEITFLVRVPAFRCKEAFHW